MEQLQVIQLSPEPADLSSPCLKNTKPAINLRSGAGHKTLNPTHTVRNATLIHTQGQRFEFSIRQRQVAMVPQRIPQELINRSAPLSSDAKIHPKRPPRAQQRIAPILEEPIVGDQSTIKPHAAGLGIQHIAKPQKRGPLRTNSVTDIERFRNLARIPEHKNNRETHAVFRSQYFPHGQQSAQTRILYNPSTFARKLVQQNSTQLIRKIPDARIFPPMIGHSTLIPPAKPKAPKDPLMQLNNPGILPIPKIIDPHIRRNQRAPQIKAQSSQGASKCRRPTSVHSKNKNKLLP